MKTAIPRIEFPELFFGFVAPIGADLEKSISEFETYLKSKQYRVVRIKVTSIFGLMRRYLEPEIALVEHPTYERYSTYIKYGNQVRKHLDDSAFLAASSISQIVRRRLRAQKEKPTFEKTAYLIHQFKRKEEIDLMRSVYGRLFFQISVYSRRGARVDYLSRNFAKSEHVSGPQNFRHLAEKLVRDDENEISETYGQRVSKIFHDADFIVNNDISKSIKEQVERFCELVFGSNSISPSKIEYGMFMAKAAALRTLDLSRQVGTAIFSPESEIISLGSNEVPKAEGGTYWFGGEFDDREYVRGHDSNQERKKEILSEIANIMDKNIDIDQLMANQKIEESQFMDALEYGRIVHAEMSAISDAARLGRSVKGGTLFCTTFPCHMCAKHIIAAGIKSVVFLEPYPKSLAFELHADSLEIEGGDRGKFKEYAAVTFEHFWGVTPRRYRELFERGSRKSLSGRFSNYIAGYPRPFIDIKFPLYASLEDHVLDTIINPLINLTVDDVVKSRKPSSRKKSRKLK